MGNIEGQGCRRVSLSLSPCVHAWGRQQNAECRIVYGNLDKRSTATLMERNDEKIQVVVIVITFRNA